MSVLQVFATPQELELTLQAFVARHKLRACQYENRAFTLLEEGSPLILRNGSVRLRIFLFPAEAWNESETRRPRDEGWIDVSPGQLVENSGVRILTLSTIQADDRAHLSFKPAAWLRGLRKSLAQTYTFGAQGRNVVKGGGNAHRDIAYSPLALELHEQGVLWKQFADGNIAFSPL